MNRYKRTKVIKTYVISVCLISRTIQLMIRHMRPKAIKVINSI